jgi:hypothetical protein
MLRHNSSFVMVSHGGVHGRCYVLNTRVSVHDLRLGEGLVMCDISNKIATRKHENVLKLAERGWYSNRSEHRQSGDNMYTKRLTLGANFDMYRVRIDAGSQDRIC